jgi:mono/diheme cytochrome c family protein
VAWKVRAASLPSSTPPPKIRSVHPSPPSTLTFAPPGATEPKTIAVVNSNSPLRALETTDPEKFREKVAHGKVVYYENCFYCHGDTMSADGHFAPAVNPPPANFQDKGTIAMLEETFIFWRIAKGGPGLPEEATPFDSSMPVWEKYLSEDDIWSASLFLYDYTGYRPRTPEAAPAAEGH